MQPKIAVVGGGIFGITCALKLAESGYLVDLFEKEDDILQAASGINQYRLHRGYHYPRSAETIQACKNSNESFISEFPDVIVNNPKQYYCVARNGVAREDDSKVTSDEYQSICKEQGLEYIIEVPDVVKPDSIDIGILAKETRWDPEKLYELCRQKIQQKIQASSVNLYLKRRATRDMFNKYDFIVIATYASINELLGQDAQRDYKFELCEKPIVHLPENYRGKGIVIMDGDFMCVDPLGNSNLHVMGHVKYAIHQTNIGKKPERHPYLEAYLNKGIILPRITNFSKFIESASQFFLGIEQAEHIGSMFTYRVVLCNEEGTDKRPTLVDEVENNIVRVFAGKVTTCVNAAEQVIEIINKKVK